MVIRMAHFPQHLAIPVRFESHAAFEWKAAEKALLRRAPVVEKRAPLGEIPGQTWRARKDSGTYEPPPEGPRTRPPPPPQRGGNREHARQTRPRRECAPT